MDSVTALNFVSLFFAGILAGMEIAIHYGLHTPIQVLSDVSQLRLRQALVLRLRVLVPIFFVPTAVSGIAATITNAGAPGFGYRLAGLIAVALWITVRIIATVPINSATVEWDAEMPPVNWKLLIHRAERFHIVGAWAAVGAFACFLIATALRFMAR